MSLLMNDLSDATRPIEFDDLDGRFISISKAGFHFATATIRTGVDCKICKVKNAENYGDSIIINLEVGGEIKVPPKFAGRVAAFLDDAKRRHKIKLFLFIALIFGALLFIGRIIWS